MKPAYFLPKKASRTVALMMSKPSGDDSEDGRIADGKRRYLDVRAQIIKELRQKPPRLYVRVG